MKNTSIGQYNRRYSKRIKRVITNIVSISHNTWDARKKWYSFWHNKKNLRTVFHSSESKI